MKKKWTFLFLGLISGLIAGYLANTIDSNIFIVGLIFGIVFGFYYRVKENKEFKKIFFWTVVTSLAFLISYFSFWGMWNPISIDSIFWFLVFFTIPGILGGGVMVFGFSKFLDKFDKKQIEILILIAGIVGSLLLSISYETPILDSEIFKKISDNLVFKTFRLLPGYDNIGYIILYWNTIMGFFIGFFLDKNQKTENLA